MTVTTNITEENIGTLVKKLREGLWDIAEGNELEPNKFHSTGEILKSKEYESKHMSWFKTKKQHEEWKNR
jgi:hypothetical protein